VLLASGAVTLRAKILPSRFPDTFQVPPPPKHVPR
jgi:hypothetical protein